MSAGRSFDSLSAVVTATIAATTISEALLALATGMSAEHHVWRAGILELRVGEPVRLRALWAPGETRFSEGWEVPATLTPDLQRLLGVVAEGKPVAFALSEVDLGLLGQVLQDEGCASFVGIPLMEGDRIPAVAWMGSAAPDGFTADDIPFFAGVGRGIEAHVLALMEDAIPGNGER